MLGDMEEIVVSEDKLDDYVEDGDTNCPNCGSYAVEALGSEWDRKIVRVSYICRTCGYEYAHVFGFEKHIVENKNWERDL